MKVQSLVLASLAVLAAMCAHAGMNKVRIKCDESVVHDGHVEYRLYSAPDTVSVGVAAMFDPADSTLTIKPTGGGGDYILQLLTGPAPANGSQQEEVVGSTLGNRVSGMQLTEDYMRAFRNAPSKWISFSLSGDGDGVMTLTLPD